MDSDTVEMVKEAYLETVAEALSRGGSPDEAHAEGITAAAMTLSSMTGVEDAEARNQVEALGLRPNG